LPNLTALLAIATELIHAIQASASHNMIPV